jgi:hypothetical protein
MDENSLLNLPLYALFISVIIGVVGSWRRAIAVFLFSYLALIIAAQHNAMITDTNFIRSLSGESSYMARSAFAYALSAIVIFILLAILLNVVWGKPENYTRKYSGFDRLLQSLITGVSGWAFGVILAICLLTYQGEDLRLPRTSPEVTIYASAIDTTADTVVNLVAPWLPDGPPQFLAEWNRSLE